MLIGSLGSLDASKFVLIIHYSVGNTKQKFYVGGVLNYIYDNLKNMC